MPRSRAPSKPSPTAQGRSDAARRALDRASEREEADRLSARLARIDQIERDSIASVKSCLASCLPTSCCVESNTPRPQSIALAISWR